MARRELSRRVHYSSFKQPQQSNACARSRGVHASELSMISRPFEDAGNAEGSIEPAASRAKGKSTRVSHHRSTEQFGIPCAVVLTASFVLSPVTGFVVTVSAMRASIIAGRQRRGVYCPLSEVRALSAAPFSRTSENNGQ